MVEYKSIKFCLSPSSGYLFWGATTPQKHLEIIAKKNFNKTRKALKFLFRSFSCFKKRNKFKGQRKR
jgi:hypothetical protein